MLFDDIKRTDLDPSYRSESIFSYINRSARDEISQCRDYVEMMYSLFPENKDIRGRIRRGDDIHFISAFTELYYQALFKALHYDVSIHPERKGASEKPDWLLTNDSGEEFYCEATVSFPEKEKRRGVKHQDDVIDYLRDNLEDGTRLSIHFGGYPETSLKPSQVKKEIQTHIDENRDSAEEDTSDMGSSKELSELTSDYISSVFVSEPKLEGVSGASISVGSGVEVVTTHIRIRERLRQKAKKYKNLETPFVIAINVYDNFPQSDDIHVEQALIGDEVVVFNEQESKLARKPNGFWGYPDNKKYSRVSGILAVDRLTPSRVENCEITLWHNPFAEFPISTSEFPFRQKIILNPNMPKFDTVPSQKPSFEILRGII